MSEQLDSTTTGEERQKSIGLWVAGIFAAISLALLVFSYYMVYVVGKGQPDLSDKTLEPVAGLMLIASLISFYLIRGNRLVLGTWIMFSIVIIPPVIAVLVLKDIFTVMILYIAIMASILVAWVLPKTSRRLAIIATGVSILAIGSIQAWNPAFRLGSSTFPNFTVYIIILAGLAIIAFFIRQTISGSIRTKMVIGFLALTTLPLIILGWQSISTTRAILEQQAGANLLRDAKSAGTDFQAFADTQISAINNTAQSTEILNYMGLSPSQRPGSEEERLAYQYLDTISIQDPSYIESYKLIDLSGIDILDTTRSNIGTSYAGQDFFKSVTDTHNPYVSGLIFSPQAGESSIYFAAPVRSKKELTIRGIFLVTYNASIIQDLFDQRNKAIQSGASAYQADSRYFFSFAQSINLAQPSATEYTYLIDSTNYFILGHSSRPDLLYKTYLGKNDARVAKLLEQSLINLNSFVIPEPEIVANLSGMKTTASFSAPSWENNNEPAQMTAVRVPNTNWIIITAQPISSITTLVQSETRVSVITGVIIISLAALLVFVVSNLFTRPIIELTRVAANISSGDFTHKADIRTKDEIGTLASTFNKMASQLSGLFGALEQRVAERTTDLEISRQQSEKRSHELQTISEISGIITSEQKTEILLPLVTRLVSERFDFYHVGIFLVDETGQWAVLQASNSEGGQRMLARGHKLEVGTTGIVGYVTKNGSPRIALDVGADSVFFNNPDLPATRSEMALPLNVRGRVIGALDVQSIKPGAFTDNDANTLSILADQIAISIENARLFGGTQNALAEVQNIYRQDIAMSWVKFAQAGGIVGYHKTLSEGKLINKTVDTDEIRQTMMRGSVIAFNADEKRAESTLVVPVKLRGQVIGVLNIRAPRKEHQWSFDEIGLVEAISERLALALENARLFEETAKRAERERRVTDITTKIRSTTDPQQMIDTAIEELRQALGATHVEVVPQRLSDMTDK